MIIERKFRVVALSICLAGGGLGGCALPEGAYYPQDAGYQPPAPQLAPFDGCWSFVTDKGARGMNRVEALDENTLLIGPAGQAGGLRQYIKVGENIYQDSDRPATYQFSTSGTGLWRSNDKRQLNFRLTHESRSC